MKKIIIFSTAYPYAAGVIAISWIGSAILLRADANLSLNFVLLVNVITSLVVASIGFRR